MGLRVKPGTDKAEKGFERAKVAIDCTSFLIDKLELHVEEKDRNALRRILSDLQINYARQRASKSDNKRLPPRKSRSFQRLP